MADIVAVQLTNDERRRSVLERDRPNHKTEYKISQENFSGRYFVSRSELMSILGDSQEKDTTEVYWVPIRKVTPGFVDISAEPKYFDTVEEAELLIQRLTHPEVRFYDSEGKLKSD